MESMILLEMLSFIDDRYFVVDEPDFCKQLDGCNKKTVFENKLDIISNDKILYSETTNILKNRHSTQM